MHSVQSRLNNIAAFGVTGAMVLCFLCAITDLFLPMDIGTPEIKINGARVDTAPDYFSRAFVERAAVNFDLKAGSWLLLWIF